MRTIAFPLAVLLLLPLAPAATAAPCADAHGCVAFALDAADRAVDDVLAALEGVDELLECTTEAFGCVPQPAKDVLTCLVHGYGCDTVYGVMALAQDVVCERLGCDD